METTGNWNRASGRTLDRPGILRGIRELFDAAPGRVVSEEAAISPVLAGLVMFDAPLAGIASAGDPLFAEYKRAVGPWHRGPEEWLPGAASIISLFFPFTERVRRSNRGRDTSPEWLHARIEGQEFISAFTKGLCRWLEERGAACCAPSIDSRFRSFRRGEGLEAYPEATDRTFGSNWSERHAAYACGLGTFSLSRGLITERGMAGRLTSVIVDAALEPDARPYRGVYDYCVRCGACVRRCPARAISLEGGKEHIPCSEWLKQSRARFAPRYGCGQCQTAVPCEDRNPAAGA